MHHELIGATLSAFSAPNSGAPLKHELKQQHALTPRASRNIPFLGADGLSA